MGGSPIPLLPSPGQQSNHNLVATNLVSNHSVIDLYLDNTFQQLKSLLQNL